MGPLVRYFSILGVATLTAIGCSSAFQSTADSSSSSGAVTISGSVSGMTGGTITLLSSTSETVNLTADGSFTFPTQIAENSTYSVTIQTQPVGHICNSSNAVGTASGTVNVIIQCVIPSGPYTVGGTVTGLTAGTLTIRNNNQNSTAITADGAYTFSLGLFDTNPYNVSVETQPAGQLCTIANGTGTIPTANVTNVNITCAVIPGGNFTIGGTVSGLSGTGLTLLESGNNTPIGGNGAYVLGTSYPDLTAYNVTVASQPTSPWQTCTPVNNNASIAGANVTNVDVNCVTNNYNVAVDITGVANNETIIIQNFGVDIVNYDGLSTAPTIYNHSVVSMGSYLITVSAPPTGKTCTVANSFGQVTNANIATATTNPQVNCVTSTHTVGGTVTGLATSGLILQNNLGDNLNVNSTSFVFSTALNFGAGYSVSVLNDPSNPKQTCVVTPATATGTISGNVTNVAVTCTTDTQGMSVSINGLGVGESIQVSNQTDVMTVVGDANVVTPDNQNFPTTLTENTDYTIQLANPSPGGLVCVVANPVGTVKTSAIVININCGTTTYTISGTITQADANTNGNTTYIRLYGSNTESLTPIYSHVQIDTTGDNLMASPEAYSFTNVPNGTYYLRAYRDIGNPRGATTPDGLPSLKQDYQSAPVMVTVNNANETGHVVNMVDTNPIVNNDHYDQFNASTLNNDEVAYVPNNGQGSGLCGGYYMYIDANIPSGTATNVTAPEVQIPGSSVVTMLDDGGCDNAVANNSNSSYDFNPNDFQYSYGIRNPNQANQMGDYKLHYRYIGGGNNFLHQEVDNVATVTRLPRNIQITSPALNSNLTTTTPTFTWGAVTGAVAYDVQISQVVNPGPGYNHNSGTLGVTTYTIPGGSALTADPDAYSIQVQAFDANSGAGNDVDAESRGVRQYFILDTTDTAGVSYVTISGTITNNSGNTASNIILEATGNEQSGANANYEEVTHIIPGNSTNYSLRVLRDAGANNDAEITAVLDVNNTLDESSYGDGQKRRYGSLDGSNNIIQNIVFSVPVVLSSPAAGATALGNTPTFSWQAYATSVANAGGVMPSGAYSYIFFYGQNNQNGGGGPVGVFGLSNATTSLNFASITSTQRYDIWCVAQPPGSWNGSTCVNGTGSPNDLSQFTNWFWGVAVVECDFNDYLSSADLNFNFVNDYLECLLPLLGNNFNPYAESGNRAFNTN